MSNKTAKTLFIPSPSSSQYAGLYQQMLSGILSFQQLGNRLIQLAEQAHAFRQFDKVKEIGNLLSNIPIKSFQAIGYYFLGVAANSMGNGDQDKAKKLFELAIDTAPDTYKIKSVLSLGALAFNRMDFDSALYFYQEPFRIGKLSIASIHAIRAISHIKSIEGNHEHAVKDLESILPLIKYTPAYIHFDTLNSYAVELGEVGRLDEAENVSRLTIASSFASYYPEWQSTYSEIRSIRKRRSTITVSRSQEPYQEPEPIEVIEPELLTNLLQFPIAQPVTPDFETTIDTLTTDGIVFTPLQLLGIILKLVLKNRITDFEIDKITTAYYRAIKDMWGE